ncbi:MAG: Crp/Fnr family transcriptional regulator [Bacteroidaceae bacterium]|nr:Crp/Fnr family transcriptional regulator [Bacteroidaceae bacterium]
MKNLAVSLNETMELIKGLTDLLSDKQKTELRRNITIQKYQKNEIIYNEGDVPTNLLCLISGKVKVYKSGVGGRTQIIRVIKPVQYLGYRAYFANQNYVTAASAFETSYVCKIPMDLVYRWMEENIALSLFFVRQLSLDLGVSDQRTVSLTQKHIRGRLAEALLFLQESYGLEEDGATLSIYLTREDLANLSNMTTANAIRTLSAFAAEKIVAIDGRKIKIIDMDAVRKISKIG